MRLMAAVLLLGLAGCGDRGQPPVAPAPAPAAPTAPAAATADVAAPVAPHLPGTVQAPAPPAVTVVLEVMPLVGRTEAEVAELLGPPASCQDIHRARLCQYPPDGNEVMFAAGKAEMITVQGMAAIAYNDTALAALGLAPAVPDHSDQYVIRWESLPDLHEVSVFPGPGNTVDFAYIKVGRH